MAVRLCEVAPDGESLLVTRGLHNLTHRDSDERPRRSSRAAATPSRVKLDAHGHAFAAGNTLRLSVSTAYWPWAWPSPEPVALTLTAARAAALPGAAAAATTRAALRPPEQATARCRGCSSPAGTTRPHPRPRDGPAEIRFDWDVGGLRGCRTASRVRHQRDTYRFTEGDPLSAEVHVRCTTALGRGDWQTCVQTDSRMTATAEEFVVTQRLDAFEDGERFRRRTWELRFLRDGV